MSSELVNPFLIKDGDRFVVKFRVTLPSPGDETFVVEELKTKIGFDGAFRSSDLEIIVDSFTGEIMTGQAVFHSAMFAERAMAVGVNSGPMTHYIGEDTVECIVDLPNREAYNDVPQHEQYLRIVPIDNFIDSTSLFDAFRSYGPIMAVRTQTVLSKKGRPTTVGAVWFYNSSSVRAAEAGSHLKSNIVDPCSITISRYPNSSQPPWNILYPTAEELENKLRTLFPSAVEFRVVDFTGELPRAMGHARYPSADAAKWSVGDRTLDTLGSSRVELTSLTRRDTLLKASVVGDDLPAPKMVPPTAAAAPVALSAPALPGSGSASPQIPDQSSRQPHASTSNLAYNSPLYPASGSGSVLISRETSLRARSKMRESRKAWSSTLKPYALPKARVRPHREGDPKAISGYSICDLPDQDLDRMKDYILSYTGSDWPDFSVGNLTKADIQKSRKARQDTEGEQLKKVITAVRAEEVKQLELAYANADLPKAGDRLTNEERLAMSASLAELETGLHNKWHHDDALLKMLRVREINTMAPPSSSSSQPATLFPHALLGILKTVQPAADDSPSPLDVPSRYPPPRFSFSPPPAEQQSRPDWKAGYPPPPKTFLSFKDGSWDDGNNGALRDEMWDFLKVTNVDPSCKRATNYKNKFDQIGYLDTFFKWHEEDKDFDRWATLDKTQVHLNQGPVATQITELRKARDPRKEMVQLG